MIDNTKRGENEISQIPLSLSFNYFLLSLHNISYQTFIFQDKYRICRASCSDLVYIPLESCSSKKRLKEARLVKIF
jgi:hypothetical protein